jgi:hypothetical protein
MEEQRVQLFFHIQLFDIKHLYVKFFDIKLVYVELLGIELVDDYHIEQQYILNAEHSVRRT